ncbi:MAG: type I pullulanase [Ruminococcaceae bacterium]|nr:type I pullulanase [Oscillospiraceae bacterium]
MIIFDTKEFIKNYTYDGNDLGAVINDDKTTFKVWAPTASRVILNLFTQGHDIAAYKNVPMHYTEKGVWEHTECCGHGTYYTYTVTTDAGTQTTADPYAKSAGVNGERSMVIDLSKTNPDDWDKDSFKGTKTYTEAVIWEVHVRDFSNKIAESKYKGKFLAFTEKGLKNSAGVSVGIDYLVNLGITHVHLLPVYDYATVDEANSDAQFNWGYDPKNYNVPEGSYSTDPYNGEVRIIEFKKMVQALHNAGIGVIMDVVYNHTYEPNSFFNRIVPGYYYRYLENGENSNASGCSNDTASERKMFRKFMVDSVSYWAKEYKLDGFRFDLMGLHDLETMKQIEKAVHKINPRAIIYGEGWTMGYTIDGSLQANQQNIGQIKPLKGSAGAVSVFNDVIRDGLKGSVFGANSRGYISGEHSNYESSVKFGISGGKLPCAYWRVDNAAVINYMSAHDNHALWDKLWLSNAEDSEEIRAKMNRLGAAIVMISQGTPFMQAGEEMLRSKNCDENSYKSSDEINNIDWERLLPGSEAYETMMYYKGLIELRKNSSVLTSQGKTLITFGNLAKGGMTVLFEYDDKSILALINPTKDSDTYTLDAEWNVLADGIKVGAETIENVSGEVDVLPQSVMIFAK